MGKRRKAKRTAGSPKDGLSPRLAAILLAAAALAVFANTLWNGFVWDDEQFILRNVYLTSWRHLPRLLVENIVAGAGQVSNLYRPLQSLSHFIDVRLWGFSPMGHHLTNILLHAGAAAAVCLWLSRFAPPAAALAIGAVAMLHPLQAEAVGYLSGRSDTMAVLLLCSGLLLFPRRRGAALACAAAAVFAKESMALFPVFLLLDRWASGADLKAEWRRHLPFWAVAVGYAVLRLTVLNFHDTLNFYGGSNILTDHPSYRLFTYLTTLPEGLRLWLWPADLHHERSWAVYTDPTLVRVWLSALFLLAWLGAAAWFRRRRPAVSAGLLWFLVASFPTSNLVVVINALFYDHWFILPGLGLALALTQFPPIRRGRPWALALCAVLSLAGAASAVRMNRVWRDPISLNRRILAYEPRNAKIHNNLAMALADAGRLKDAVRHYRTAIALSDEYPQTHHNLARAFERLGRYPEAAAEYGRAIKLDPRFYHSQQALGWLMLRSGRPGQARQAFMKAVEAYPYAVEAYAGLAQLRLSAGDKKGAREELERGLEAVEDPRLRAALGKLAAPPERPAR